MKWLVLSPVLVAGAFGVLVGLAMMLAIWALLMGLRLLVVVILATIATVRSHFVPTPPPPIGRHF